MLSGRDRETFFLEYLRHISVPGAAYEVVLVVLRLRVRRKAVTCYIR